MRVNPRFWVHLANKKCVLCCARVLVVQPRAAASQASGKEPWYSTHTTPPTMPHVRPALSATRLPIIHPNSKFRIGWDVFVLALVCYNAIMVPYQVRHEWSGALTGRPYPSSALSAHPQFVSSSWGGLPKWPNRPPPPPAPPSTPQIGFSTPQYEVLDPLNYAIDIVFVLDICLNFRTAYFDSTATLVRG